MLVGDAGNCNGLLSNEGHSGTGHKGTPPRDNSYIAVVYRCISLLVQF